MVSRHFLERWQKGAMCAIALFAPEPMAKMRVAREKMKLVANGFNKHMCSDPLHSNSRRNANSLHWVYLLLAFCF
jgi:hypothetical protein